MKKIDVTKILYLIVRATGIIFWYNFLGCMFFKEATGIKMIRVVIMIISLSLGYLSKKEKSKIEQKQRKEAKKCFFFIV